MQTHKSPYRRCTQNLPTTISSHNNLKWAVNDNYYSSDIQLSKYTEQTSYYKLHLQSITTLVRT